MRVIAGRYRGHRLAAPRGGTTRPTTDRVKESLMSSLAHVRGGFEGARVLDAFAGSGSLGIEALSRGAEYAEFYEKDQGALVALQKNIFHLKMSTSTACIVKADIFKSVPSKSRQPFDIVFLDPPYSFASEHIFQLVMRLRKVGVIKAGAFLVYEHDKTTDMTPFSTPALVRVLFSKSYGDTTVDIIEMK